MEKDELIEMLQDSRQEWIEMLADVSETDMTTPGVCGTWSIKDVLAHLTQWEGQTVTLLFQVRQGMAQPSVAFFGDESDEVLNTRWNQQSQERSLEIIWNDFVTVRKQTIRRLSEYSPQELNDPQRYLWQKGTPLWKWVISTTIDHEEEHVDAIREWLEARENHTNGAKP